MSDKKVIAGIELTKVDASEASRPMKEFHEKYGTIFDSERSEVDMQEILKDVSKSDKPSQPESLKNKLRGK
ncbi:TPA: hypothetical protein JG825_003458 [Vibrio parahaemolyticus]|nr:hypothetical protein [Vibrio parahaemolyticus]UPR19080.1 hypothetical protein H9J99_25890 [Vibrio parahaemolyticus]HAV1520139.1 hypothetical protein [Vibrio parahaemolyticus]HAV1539106.1 hypothetical protein [Vibrio parahaemolyticus]